MNVLNLDKEFKHQPLLFGDDLGLFDSIHVHPEVEDLNKRATAQIWRHDEFSFAPCASEFLEDDDGRHLMVETLRYQWLADSCACNLYTLLQPFISCDGLAQLTLFNTWMECEHSRTYSEIVKTAFPNPQETIEETAKDETALNRIELTKLAFERLRKAGLDYTTGKATKADVFAEVYKGIVALYLLERVAFIASFAVTFALGEMGRFVPVTQAVRKICADELIIHADADLLMLREMRDDELWATTNTPEFQAEVLGMVDEVIERELQWVDAVFANRSLPGITGAMLKEWVLFNAQIVKGNLQLPHNNKHKTNPLPYMRMYLTMNASQVAPQELSDSAQYLIGNITNDVSEIDMEI